MHSNNKAGVQYITPSVITVDFCHEGVLCASGDDPIFENEIFDGCTDYGSEGWN